MGNGVWVETKGDRRRVRVGATVCLREGSYGLECLLCRRRTKEHESILVTDADARIIHAALLLAGAEPGSPVQYKEVNGGVITIPPHGSRIKVTLEYQHNGKWIAVPAQQWVRNSQAKRDLEGDWVFAGSQLWSDPQDKKEPVYAASSDGGYICIYNLPSALLDLPIKNPNKGPEEREFQPHTERIPPLETSVTVVLELYAPSPAK